MQRLQAPDGASAPDTDAAPTTQARQVQLRSSGSDTRDVDAINKAAWEGTSGPSTEMPHQQQIQQSFGHHDVSGIQAHVGGPAEAATQSMGAVAYASGDQVAFGAQPSLHTAAHEAAHVVQQRAGVSLKSGVGETGDTYEQQADAVADKVVAGQSAQPLLDGLVGAPSAGGGRGVQQKAVQMEAQVMANDAHTQADIGQGTQTNAQGVATAAPTAAQQAASPQNQKVTVVAGPTHKLKLDPGAAPTQEQLYRTGDGHQCHNVQGTLAAPNTRPKMVDDCLFINGGVQAGDVRQGGIGDCYFQSVLLGIINGDPAKITGMMSAAGGNVSTTFNRLNTASNTWVPVTMSEPNTVQTQADGSLQGASFRIASNPKECYWYAQIDGDTLQVYREDKFECAMWGPMMEKAYADFAAQYGQYGDGLRADTGQTELTAGKGGYDILDGGGSAQLCYRMFYGGAATSTTVDVNSNPNSASSLVRQNLPAISNMLDFMSHRDQPGPAGGAQRFLQARISPDGAIDRCKALILLVQREIHDRYESSQTSWYSGITDWIGATHDEEHHQQYEASGQTALSNALTPLLTAINTYKATANASTQPVANAARLIQAPGAYPALWANSNQHTTELRENLGTIINLGTDNGPGRRTLYAAHSYNVHSANFNKTDGQPLAVNAGNLAALADQIDARRSNVVMQNPHATNEWDEAGTGAPDGADQGTFTLSLDQFLRSVDLLRSASVAVAPQVGDFPTPTPGPGGTQTA